MNYPMLLLILISIHATQIKNDTGKRVAAFLLILLGVLVGFL